MSRRLLLLPLAFAACSDLAEVGRAPEFNPITPNLEHHALYTVPLPDRAERRRAADTASLWSSSGDRSLFSDRRATSTGDILTVVIEINDSAQITNTSQRGRTGSQSMGVPQLLGLPQLINDRLPDGASMGDAV
ncbi:MAG: flagellar basal body L-ring protein FlgH, partial [Pararhodobacter sp.]